MPCIYNINIRSHGECHAACSRKMIHYKVWTPVRIVKNDRGLNRVKSGRTIDTLDIVQPCSLFQRRVDTIKRVGNERTPQKDAYSETYVILDTSSLSHTFPFDLTKHEERDYPCGTRNSLLTTAPGLSASSELLRHFVFVLPRQPALASL